MDYGTAALHVWLPLSPSQALHHHLYSPVTCLVHHPPSIIIQVPCSQSEGYTGNLKDLKDRNHPLCFARLNNFYYIPIFSCIKIQVLSTSVHSELKYSYMYIFPNTAYSSLNLLLTL